MKLKIVEKIVIFLLIVCLNFVIFTFLGYSLKPDNKDDKPETNVFQIGPSPYQTIKLVKVKPGYCVSILENRGSITTVAMNRIPCSYLEGVSNDQ